MTLFIKRSDKIGGPFSNDQIKTAVNNGKLRASDEASESRDGPWKPISQTTILDSNNELDES